MCTNLETFMYTKQNKMKKEKKNIVLCAHIVRHMGRVRVKEKGPLTTCPFGVTQSQLALSKNTFFLFTRFGITKIYTFVSFS